MVGLRKLYGAACACVVAIMMTSGARTLYVAPNGDDQSALPDDRERPFRSLTNAFRSLKNGDRLEIGPGKYVITPGYPNTYYPLEDRAEMKLQNLTNVTVAGDGEVEIYGEGPGDFLMIENCKNVRLENVTFKGNRPPVLGNPPELYSMVLLRAHNDSLQFERCRFLGFGNHGIAHLYSTKTSVNMVVTNCYFADGGALDVALLGADGAAVGGISSGSKVIKNVVENCLRGFEVEGAYSGQITNVLIEGNLITNCYGAGIMLFATDHLGSKRPDMYSDIRVINNKIIKMFSHPDREPYITFGIYFLGGEKIRIEGNVVKDAPLGMGIEASSLQMGMRDVTVMSNVVEDVRFRGIQIYNFGTLENAVVQGNTVRRTGDEGILLNGKNMECRNNLVEDTAWVGERASITLSAGGVDCIIADNDVRNRNLNYADYGIWLRGASNTTVFGNTIAGVPGIALKDEGTNTAVFPKFHSMERLDSIVNLTASGKPGAVYRLEVSNDLGGWLAVTNKTCPNTATLDFEYAAGPSRLRLPETFFRIVEVDGQQ